MSLKNAREQWNKFKKKAIIIGGASYHLNETIENILFHLEREESEKCEPKSNEDITETIPLNFFLEHIYQNIIAKYQAVHIELDKKEIRLVLKEYFEPHFMKKLDEGCNFREEQKKLEEEFTKLITKKVHWRKVNE